jgi:SanA protein
MAARRRNRLRKLLRLLAWLMPAIVLFVVLSIWTCSLVVSTGTKQFIYDNIENLPENRVGLLLGTSKYTPAGQINPFYQYRIDAAVELFEGGKIDYIIVSGDNRHHTYNEPREMRRDLINAGIPQERIVADFAGFRTLDSVIRSQKVFGQDSITIISQHFHIERALYIARHHGYDAVGYAARDVPRSYGFKTYVREYLARVKLMLDLYIYKTEPMFLGDKIEIGK